MKRYALLPTLVLLGTVLVHFGRTGKTQAPARLDIANVAPSASAVADARALAPLKTAAAPNTSGAPSTAARELADRALDAALDDGPRWHALFTLTQQQPLDVREVGRVAAAHYETTGPRASFEIRLRVHALAALDHAATTGADVTDALTTVATTQPDENLRLFAMTALAGIEQGRPGKLDRLFNLLIAQEKK